MAEVVWTAEARRWLQHIYDYIAEDNERAAYRTVLGIHARAGCCWRFRKSATGMWSNRRCGSSCTGTIELLT